MSLTPYWAIPSPHVFRTRHCIILPCAWLPIDTSPSRHVLWIEQHGIVKSVTLSRSIPSSQVLWTRHCIFLEMTISLDCASPSLPVHIQTRHSIFLRWVLLISRCASGQDIASLMWCTHVVMCPMEGMPPGCNWLLAPAIYSLSVAYVVVLVHAYVQQNWEVEFKVTDNVTCGIKGFDLHWKDYIYNHYHVIWNCDQHLSWNQMFF